MTLEQYAYLAEIIGVIVIVATLIYLAIQTRQNNQLLAAQARAELISQRSAMVDTVLAPHVLEALQKYATGSDATAAQRSTALLYALKLIEMWEWQYSEHVAGTLSLKELPLAAWRIYFRGEGPAPVPVAEVWQSRRDAMQPDFVKFIEENVADQ